MRATLIVALLAGLAVASAANSDICEDDTEYDGSAEFTAAALFRLGGLFLAEDAWCPKCDQALSRSCAHAARCRGGGDMAVRHNGIRDECFFRCLAAGWPAERELSGLLPSDPARRDLPVSGNQPMGAWALGRRPKSKGCELSVGRGVAFPPAKAARWKHPLHPRVEASLVNKSRCHCATWYQEEQASREWSP